MSSFGLVCLTREECVRRSLFDSGALQFNSICVLLVGLMSLKQTADWLVKVQRSQNVVCGWVSITAEGTCLDRPLTVSSASLSTSFIPLFISTLLIRKPRENQLFVFLLCPYFQPVSRFLMILCLPCITSDAFLHSIPIYFALIVIHYSLLLFIFSKDSTLIINMHTKTVVLMFFVLQAQLASSTLLKSCYILLVCTVKYGKQPWQ